MLVHFRKNRRRNLCNERGATVVEAAIAAPIIMFLIFAVFSSMFLIRAHLDSRFGSTAGARAGAVAGSDPAADYDILQAVRRATVAASQGSIERVVVYHADSPQQPVPSQCLQSAQAGLCNVYASADLSRPQSDFGSANWTGDDFWAASSRSTSRATGADYLGVYVEASTGLPSDSLPSTLTSTTISRLESTTY